MCAAFSFFTVCHVNDGSKGLAVAEGSRDGTPSNKSTLISNPPSSVDEVSFHNIGVTEVKEFIKSLILKKKPTQSFFVVDLMKVQRLYRNWKRLLPRVEVFYAVKCSPEVARIRLLAEMGSSFDCASEYEIQLVMSQGVPANKIIFANPCKQPNEMVTAQELGVQLTTFDTEYELEKLSRYTPDAKAVLRIQADDPTAMVSFGNKFGAEVKELPGIYAKAKELGVEVVGVCFHIGTGAKDPKAFTAAITQARKAFDLGLQQGFDMSILDIGGGFSAGHIDDDLSAFEAMTRAVNAALDRYFPAASGVRIIAEPGRFLMETCATMACNIFGVRERTVDDILHRDYWITDGVHGSFSPMTVGLTKVTAYPLKFSESTEEETFTSTVFGPTLNGNDFVLKGVNLPKLFADDWLLFPNMGAYTFSLSTNFNGMHRGVDVFYTSTGINNSS